MPADLRRLCRGDGRAAFPATRLDDLVTADFRDPMALGEEPFDGLLAANSLHFVRDPARCDRRRPAAIAPGGAALSSSSTTADSGNPWVPHPFAFETWQADRRGRRTARARS